MFKFSCQFFVTEDLVLFHFGFLFCELFRLQVVYHFFIGNRTLETKEASEISTKKIQTFLLVSFSALNYGAFACIRAQFF